MIRIRIDLLSNILNYMYSEPSLILDIKRDYLFLVVCLEQEENLESYIYLINLLSLQRLNLGVELGRMSKPYISVFKPYPILIRDEKTYIKVTVPLQNVIDQLTYSLLPANYVKYMCELLEHYILKHDLQEIANKLYNSGYDNTSVIEMLESVHQYIDKLINNYSLDLLE